jgi:Fe-S cluster biogenesis protein NfuA
MAPVNPVIRAVVDQVNSILTADGGSLAVEEQRGGTLVLRSTQGMSGDCPECALSDESVPMLVRESLALRAPFIGNVQLVRAE